jgi:hypothetical protein
MITDVLNTCYTCYLNAVLVLVTAKLPSTVFVAASNFAGKITCIRSRNRLRNATSNYIYWNLRIDYVLNENPIWAALRQQLRQQRPQKRCRRWHHMPHFLVIRRHYETHKRDTLILRKLKRNEQQRRCNIYHYSSARHWSFTKVMLWSTSQRAGVRNVRMAASYSLAPMRGSAVERARLGAMVIGLSNYDSTDEQNPDPSHPTCPSPHLNSAP